MKISTSYRVSLDITSEDANLMKLKKTTVLTGNHAVKRDRAQSDTDALNSMFKNELSNHLSANASSNSPDAKVASAPPKTSAATKKWITKSNQHQLEILNEEYVAYRKKSHAV